MDTNSTNNQSEKLTKAFKKEEKSLAGFFIKRYRFTYLILIVIFILGIYSLLTIPKEAEPEIKIPYATVTTIYMGASPTDMEELISNKIEDEISNLDNLKEYNSSSGQSVSSVFVEFEASADLDKSFRELREAVDNAKASLPSEAETPVVTEINFSDAPIITYSLVGDSNYKDLKKHADDLQEKLEKIKGVSEVNIIGGMDKEFQIIADQGKLSHFNISLSQVVSAIQSTNFDLPAGDIEIDNFKYNVRLKGKFENIEDLKQVIIATYDNSPVYLSDVAQIINGYKEKKTGSKIGFKNESSKNTISLQVHKKTGGNILDIVENANKIITVINTENELQLDNFKIVATNDNSKYIKEDINTLGMSGIQTITLITLILLMILSFRGAIITAMIVPISFLMSFFWLKVAGMTINSTVLFSLVLSLGLIVDNAIVIIEGINEYISEHKKPIYEAAILSVWNFKWAIISGTMTTVSAFVGMFLVSGIMGEYISIIPKTLIITLLSSLFAAIVIIPTLSARFIKIETTNGKSHRNKARHRLISKYIQKLHVKYKKLLLDILPNKNKRRVLLAGAWFFFFTTLALPVVGLMKIELFPVIDFDYFIVNIELPVGSTLESTEKISIEVEDIVNKIPELNNYVISLGASASSNAFSSGGSGNTHLSNIMVNLVDKKERDRKSHTISNDVRAKIRHIQGAVVTIEEIAAGPPSGAPIEVRIFGDELPKISKLTNEIDNYFKGITGVINVKNSIENSAGDFTFSVDKQKASYYGLSIASIAGTLRNAVYGTTASTVNIDDTDVDITVKYAKNSFNDISDLENILLPSQKGDIPLKQIASLKLEPSLLSIKHRDGKRIMTVTADNEKSADLRKIISKKKKKKESMNIPDGYSIEIGGETEDTQKSFTEMFASVIIGIILIYTILVLMFNSFKQPFIVIFSLPLAIPGVILGLMIFGQAFSITAFIGIIALAGIVVNDSIVLIDKINKNLEDGMEFIDAIISGGISRMQPIFVTTLTTVIGILPLYFANEMWKGLSLTVMTGLTVSTLLTLVLIPTMYTSLCWSDHEKNKKLT